MTLKAYLSCMRRLHAAYLALDAATGAAPYEAKLQIGAAMDKLRATTEQFAVQTCRRCDAHGRHYVTDSSWTDCQHPDVPPIDIRTGERS